MALVRVGTGLRYDTPVSVKAVSGRAAGSAVDLGMGQGRNAFYLAEQGWRTTGVDFSDVAIGHAKTEAVKRGLKLEAIAADLETYELGTAKWD